MKKGALPPGRRGPRAQPGRAEHQGAPGMRWARAAIEHRDHARPAPRLHATRGRPRRHPSGPTRGAWAAENQTGPGAGGQGVQLPALPGSFATAGHPAHDPGAERPASTAGQTAWPSADLRPGGLPGPQCGGALHQPAQAMAGGGHPLRQARGELPGRRRDRRSHALDARLIRQTRPSTTAVVAMGMMVVFSHGARPWFPIPLQAPLPN
jgi:hypothetical protein